MKKTILFIASLMLLASSCEVDSTGGEGNRNAKSYKLNVRYPEGSRFICTITVDTIRGHEYIIAEESNALSIVHAASCQCLQKKDENPFTTTEETSNDYNW